MLLDPNCLFEIAPEALEEVQTEKKGTNRDQELRGDGQIKPVVQIKRC